MTRFLTDATARALLKICARHRVFVVALVAVVISTIASLLLPFHGGVARGSGAVNSIAVDANPSTASTDPSFSVIGTAQFSIGINAAAAGIPYAGYQVEVQFRN